MAITILDVVSKFTVYFSQGFLSCVKATKQYVMSLICLTSAVFMTAGQSLNEVKGRIKREVKGEILRLYPFPAIKKVMR